jgi:hypothetical protein
MTYMGTHGTTRSSGTVHSKSTWITKTDTNIYRDRSNYWAMKGFSNATFDISGVETFLVSPQTGQSCNFYAETGITTRPATFTSDTRFGAPFGNWAGVCSTSDETPCGRDSDCPTTETCELYRVYSSDYLARNNFIQGGGSAGICLTVTPGVCDTNKYCEEGPHAGASCFRDEDCKTKSGRVADGRCVPRPCTRAIDCGNDPADTCDTTNVNEPPSQQMKWGQNTYVQADSIPSYACTNEFDGWLEYVCDMDANWCFGETPGAACSDPAGTPGDGSPCTVDEVCDGTTCRPQCDDDNDCSGTTCHNATCTDFNGTFGDANPYCEDATIPSTYISLWCNPAITSGCTLEARAYDSSFGKPLGGVQVDNLTSSTQDATLNLGGISVLELDDGVGVRDLYSVLSMESLAADPTPLKAGFIWLDGTAGVLEVSEDGSTTVPLRLAYVEDWFDAASCTDGVTAVLNADTRSDQTGPTPECEEGTNQVSGVANMVDASDIYFYRGGMVPEDWDGTIPTVDVLWFSTQTTADSNPVLYASIECIGDSDSKDPTWTQNGNSLIQEILVPGTWDADATSGDLVISDYPVEATNCAAGEDYRVRFWRDGNHVNDTLNADMKIIRWRIRWPH